MNGCRGRVGRTGGLAKEMKATSLIGVKEPRRQAGSRGWVIFAGLRAHHVTPARN